MGKRFVEAFRRAEYGEVFDEQHATLLSFNEIVGALTPRRLELLKHLHKSQADNINALTRKLGRSYRRVHEDVKALESAGLIIREDGNLSAPWAVLAAEVAL
jgi:predicted transcriptional regulator